MKQIRWINLGMILIMLIASLATVSTAAAGEPVLDPLLIKKSVKATVSSGWEWDILKTADVASLLLSPGQIGNINYTVELSATEVTSTWHVSGTVDVRNQTSAPVMVESIIDSLDDGTPIVLACDRALPYALPAGNTIHCTYSQDLANGDATANTATVTYEGGVASITKTFTFEGGSDSQDECVDVFDTHLPDGLGVVCAGDADKTFTYSIEVGPFEACTLHLITNEASFMAKDSGAYGSSVVEIPVEVPCVGGCTLTPGYWKTHSTFGPAPYDDTWAQIGEDTLFFLSGMSYYDVLWTAPQGNAYYILAHAYIAAELNELNGANFTAAQAAFDAATVLFTNNTPAQVGALRGAARNVWINLATTLDNYNNGLIGPGHCSE